jgi:hypothetical protein
MDALFTLLLEAINEILTAAIVIIAASLLLYNLSRNLNNRVARSSGIVLASVTVAYIFDVLVSLNPAIDIKSALLRLQWLGIAFIPAAMFHLSDALLATTGLPSRGRRRRIVRILYLIGATFFITATLTNLIIEPVIGTTTNSMEAQLLFPVYALFFLMANIATFINLQRARQRCLTTSTQRRMAYLQAAILTPAIGIFPYSVFLSSNAETLSLWVLVLVNTANIIVILMLLFLSYPLSFFGSDKPDRVVKVELLRFLLRGPGTGLLALAMIILTTRSSQIIGIDGIRFMPFAVVAVVLVWQWSIDIALPYLERLLVYNQEDDEHMTKLQNLSDRLLTHNDLLQLLEANLEACCDYLRAPAAFVLLRQQNQFELIQKIGESDIDTMLSDSRAELGTALQNSTDENSFVTWHDYQVIPIRSLRQNDEKPEPIVNGIMGIWTDVETLQIVDDETVLERFVQRTQQVLDDMLLQNEILAALEGLLPQIMITRSRSDAVEYRPGRNLLPLTPNFDRDDIYEQVRAALRHYWGGPGLMRSRLLDFDIVQAQINDETTPVQALRNVLQQAIEKQRPDGQRSMTSPEWTIFNILDLRFVERKKVAEVARRMALSQSDLFRKQRSAIDAVTDTFINLENDYHQENHLS